MARVRRDADAKSLNRSVMALTGEARSELLKNVSNFRLDLIKLLVNGSLIVKGYEDGKMELHLHAAVRVPNGNETISGSGDGERLICAVLRQSDALRGAKVADGEVSMFVLIRDGLKALRPVHSAVRLIPIDHCRMFRVNSVEPGTLPSPLGRQPTPEDIRVAIDGELSAMLLSAGIEHRQFVDKIVKRPSEGLNELADQDAKPERNLGLAWTPAERRHLVRQMVGIRIGVEGTDHSLDFTIDQGGANFLQSCQVFFCPIKPLISAVQVGHDVYSGHGQGETGQAANPEGTRNPHPTARGVPSRSQEGGQGQPPTPAPLLSSTSPLEHLF